MLLLLLLLFVCGYEHAKRNSSRRTRRMVWNNIISHYCSDNISMTATFAQIRACYYDRYTNTRQEIEHACFQDTSFGRDRMEGASGMEEDIPYDTRDNTTPRKSSKLISWTTGRVSVTAERRVYGKISTRPSQRPAFFVMVRPTGFGQNRL